MSSDLLAPRAVAFAAGTASWWICFFTFDVKNERRLHIVHCAENHGVPGMAHPDPPSFPGAERRLWAWQLQVTVLTGPGADEKFIGC